MQAFRKGTLPVLLALGKNIGVCYQRLDSHCPHLLWGDELEVRVDDRKERWRFYRLFPDGQFAAATLDIAV